MKLLSSSTGVSYKGYRHYARSCESRLNTPSTTAVQYPILSSSSLSTLSSSKQAEAAASINNADVKTMSSFNKIRREKIGLYDPMQEKDSCGVALIANLKAVPSHQVVKDANKMLERMHHRGGCGCEPNTGDGAGILLGMPDKFFKKTLSRILQTTGSSSGVVRTVPEKGHFGCGIVFMSHDSATQTKCKSVMEKQAPNYGLKVLGWREVPTNSSGLGKSALESEPHMENVFIENVAGHDSATFERKLYLLRKVCDREIAANEIPDWYVCSLSARTITYKGQLTSAQLPAYYLDLVDPSFETHMAMVHSRFSTNTFPSWDRAQPCRMLCHNGEINTLRGNKNWMKARSGIMSSPHFTDAELQKALLPVNSDEMTDSGNVDAVLELLVRASDRSLVESMMMLIPEAWQNDTFITKEKKAFYEFNSYNMEPWDGPAMMAFTDGRYLGAVLDRNGLRPSRFYVTNDDRVLLSSEVGVLPELPVEKVVMKGRLEPGKVFLIDFERGGIVRDKEIKETVSAQRPYGQWLNEHSTSITKWKEASSNYAKETKNALIDRAELNRKLHAFGFTTETLDLLLNPMAATGKEALGSMGVDTPLAVLSKLPKQPSDYFKQLFAQVTNPPIDPIREEIVMTLECPIGPEGNLLSVEPKHAERLVLKDPILSTDYMDMMKACDSPTKAFRNKWWTKTIDITFDRNTGGEGLKKALDHICNQAISAIEKDQVPLLVLSHDNVSANKIGIPSLIALGAVHQKLVSSRLRAKTSIIVDCGDAREVHDFCTLVGFGADAVCPRVSYHAIEHILFKDNRLAGVSDASQALYNYRKACGKGILKVMSKMGISTLQSYKGAQIFEAVGLNEEVVETCFAGTASRISGVGFDIIAKDAEARHAHGYPIALVSSLPFSSSTAEAAARVVQNDVVQHHPHGELHPAPPTLLNPGDYHFRHKGEKHLNDPLGMALLQESARKNSREAYTKYSKIIEQLSRDCSIRGLLELDTGSSPSVPLSEVEPVTAILRRFVTGAMSLGSISSETHETLAIAMNRMNARSNTGEGGEDPIRFAPLPNGDSKRSSIKQIASGRFGVTSHYLANADQLQIKMAQGAKPGEGGELPGYKVSAEIARVRGTTPGVGLISPPPHHDIYSIEDLAQLIHDLKNSNPSSSVSVKLVSEVGVGVVAAGVAKAKADHIVVSGGDGGTGAAAWTGIHRAGLPWELGLAEAQQTLIMNDLRSRIVLQTDGQLKNGRDVVIAALLGAEEFGFSTAPLIALGCIMMRKCHLNTCPVGIATQDPVLRAKFEGLPEHVVNFFHLLAEEVREYMAALGFRKMEEMIGRADKLKFSPSSPFIKDDVERYEKLKGLNLDSLLFPGSELNPDAIPRNVMGQDHELNLVLDNKFISRIRESLLQPKSSSPDGSHQSLSMEFPISNVNRSVGAMLSYHISKRYGANGLPDDTIRIKLRGSGGQSLGFVLARGITMELEGDSNDSVGKGLSGGKIIIYPHKEQLDNGFVAEDNVIVGNVALYGATSGEAFFRGRAGERFAVRNSGANAVVEGLGDHGCEYMTGGRVVILGETGRNFAAGMSGGIAFVYDPENKLNDRCNHEMVSLTKVVDPIDQDLLLSLIEKHLRYTGSPVAQQIIQNWNESLNSFVQVLPNDYAVVLQKERSAQKQKSYA